MVVDLENATTTTTGCRARRFGEMALKNSSRKHDVVVVVYCFLLC